MIPSAPPYRLAGALARASLLVRLAGDLAGLTDVRRWGGALNAVAILLFLLVTAAGVLWGHRARRPKDKAGRHKVC